MSSLDSSPVQTIPLEYNVKTVPSSHSALYQRAAIRLNRCGGPPEQETFLIAEVRMDGESQNLLNLALILALIRELLDIAHNPVYDAVLLTSTDSFEFFSSGPPLKILRNATWSLFSVWYDSLLRLNRLLWLYPKPLVACITGHCPSLALALITAADWRVMSPETGTTDLFRSETLVKRRSISHNAARIGFNDVQFGYTAPLWLTGQLHHIIGGGATELFLRDGKMHSASEAKSMGLIDAIAPNSVLREAALSFLGKNFLTTVPIRSQTFRINKMSLRMGLAARLFQNDFSCLVKTMWINMLEDPRVKHRI